MKTKRFSRIRLINARGAMSRGELAVAIGVSFATIRNWECGRSTPTAENLAAVAAVLRREPGFFFEDV